MKWMEPTALFSKSSGNFVYRRTDGRTDGWTDIRWIQYTPFHLRWSGGIKTDFVQYNRLSCLDVASPCKLICIRSHLLRWTICNETWHLKQEQFVLDRTILRKCEYKLGCKNTAGLQPMSLKTLDIFLFGISFQWNCPSSHQKIIKGAYHIRCWHWQGTLVK